MLEECVKRLLTWKEAMEKKGLKVTAGKTKIMICGTGPPAKFRRVSMRRLSHWSGQQQHLLQCLQALCVQEMQWAQALEKRPWLQMYTVPGTCMPLGWQTTEGSPGRTWQAWGGSFLLLPRRYALSSRWLWTFNHNTCENSLEEVQGSATSSLFTPPLFQNTWPCVQLLCASTMLRASETWPLTKPNRQRLQRNDKTMIRQICNIRPQDIVITRSNDRATCAAWHWGSGPYSEGEKTPMVWTCGTLQWCSKDSLWHTGWWKAWAWEAKMTWKQLTERDCREWKLSAINPHDRHSCISSVRSAMRAASQLSGMGGPLVWMLPLYLHVNQKSDYDIWNCLMLFRSFGSVRFHVLAG